MKLKQNLYLIILLISGFSTFAQNNNQTQKVKGIVIDADSKKPLEGAEVTIVETAVTTKTNSQGEFFFEGVNVGTISINVNINGYENRGMPEITVTSGKEVELSIALSESISNNLQEVVVSSKRSRTKPVNEFATVSARSINIQDTKRYPAAISDPARMVQNFAGVSASNDSSNEIVVRGNSPQSVLWRLEGVEIPNPNHFAGIAAGGGAVSMFSSTTLGNSDFYSGAFPSEFGNATAGVFDLYYRNGNKDKREYAFNAGVIGLGAGIEGPFVKGGKSTYLVNYRYSTFGLLQSFLPFQSKLNYQDLNFKLNFPTAAGTFGLFGLVGINSSIRDAKRDQENKEDYDIFEFRTNLSVFGLTHQVFVSDKSYFKTVISRSSLNDSGDFNALIPDLNFIKRQFSEEKTKNNDLRVSSFFNSKLSAKSTLRIGGIFSNLDFSFKNTQFKYAPLLISEDLLDIKGNTNYVQGYAQFKYRATEELTLNLGFHSSYLALNKTRSIEPRAAISYGLPNSQTLTLAAGIHAKPQPLSTYFSETINTGGARQNLNKNLKMTQAFHLVLGYEKAFNNGIKLKAETYYQSLSNIPVEARIGSGFSAINSSSVLDLLNTDQLVSQGKGTNYGVDFNLEKSFNKSYYFISNLSLYSSKYTAFDKKEYNTRFNRSYQLNLVGGKEWSVSNKKNRILGINGKLLTTGGQRQTEIDLPASQAAGETVLVPGKFFNKITDPYFRFDLGLSLKTNRTKTTHIISLDIQNVLNRLNKTETFFNSRTNKLSDGNQLGIIPILNYRVEF
jgi:Carboxypeptidase regulatory-like domain/TonB-dependent Receptor Plug Domain